MLEVFRKYQDRQETKSRDSEGMIMGFIVWLKTLFVSNTPSQSENKRRNVADDEEEEIEELIAIDII